ncbi:hypothetical protein DOTSEDRAFT_70063 [Dothistroma septosporum NZE10]|uniref:Uncharacterized protein n=1 Tax=Dothistroma septosporum (strain NZE10 / CBS 128990) TaxID=675120 RepID=N1PRA2_DOTSN|nr:hypothetical protein DOTSEDRAFT_70063 [Dothistroma septosporum NZE10]
MRISTGLPHAAKAIVGLVAVYIIYQLFVSTTSWTRRRAFKRQRGVLEAPKLPQWDRIYGIDLFLENIKALKEHRLLELAYGRFTKTGINTMQFTALGRHLHMTIEPENLKTIQAIDQKKWGLGERRKVGFMPLLGVGIFTTDGAEWQHSRDMLRPNFVRSQVGDLATFEKHVSNLIAAVPAGGTTVDLSELFFRLTIDSATEFLFGESTESLTRDSSEGFAEAFTYSQDFIANRSRWGAWAMLFKANDRFEKDKKFVHDFVDYFVQKGLAKRSQKLAEKSRADVSGRYVFMDELVKQTTDPIRIRSELLNILLAGRDTTASLLTNAWFILSKRPDIWTKLQADVASLNGAKPTFEQLKDLKYLKALLNESLRMHPVVPMNSREALEDTTLPLGGGPDGRAPILIKKAEIMVWSLYAMHRRKDYYGEDAEEFRPERWLDDPETGKKGLRPGWEYLPFNGGARICLGQQFALTEASYTTVRLCQAFSGIKSRDPEGWREMLTLTCVNLNGAKVALTPRSL